MVPPSPENREGRCVGQPPSCLVLSTTKMRRLSTANRQHNATYTHLVALCCRFVVALLPFHAHITTHAIPSRFCLVKSHTITIPATCRSSLRSSEGRLLHGQIIHVSRILAGRSFNGVGLPLGMLFSGLVVRILSRFQQTILPGTLRQQVEGSRTY